MRFFRGGVCEDCWSAIPLPDAGCPICADPLPGADPSGCGRCLLSPPAFARLSAAAPYRGAARDILIAFKFGGADFLASRLAAFMAERIAPDGFFDEVVAVPATARARLFTDHGAERLGRAVAERLKIGFAGSRLEKIRGTRRQSTLPAARRAANVRGAFSARAGAPRRVLLVDDVATSGSTARECALALVRAGAEEVEVWCFARASRDGWLAGDRDSGFGTRDSAESPC